MTTSDDAFTISFPAQSGYLRVCRLTAAAAAANMGFDVDQLDDLRLAVDEAVTWLLHDVEAGGRVEISLVVEAPTLVIHGTREGASLPERPVDDLVHAILGATLDDHALDTVSGRRSIRLETSLSAG